MPSSQSANLPAIFPTHPAEEDPSRSSSRGRSVDADGFDRVEEGREEGEGEGEEYLPEEEDVDGESDVVVVGEGVGLEEA